MLVGAAAMLLQTTGELDSYFSGWFDTTPQEARERAAVAVARVEHFLWPSVHPKPERST